MFKIVAGGTALMLSGGLAVLGAQHLTQDHRAPGAQMYQHACADSSNGQSGSHVPDHLAKILDLSAAQITELDTKAAEACRVMTRMHAEMLQVLTPDQRARMEELHRSHGSSGVAEWLKKLHGR